MPILTLGDRQKLFAKLFGEWLVWVHTLPGVSVALSEGYVGISAPHSGPHIKNGGHYNKLAHDVDLFVDGLYISDGNHPMWQKIGQQWEGMHSETRWGGHFSTVDSNHISIIYNGVA